MAGLSGRIFFAEVKETVVRERVLKPVSSILLPSDPSFNSNGTSFISFTGWMLKGFVCIVCLTSSSCVYSSLTCYYSGFCILKPQKRAFCIITEIGLLIGHRSVGWQVPFLSLLELFTAFCDVDDTSCYNPSFLESMLLLFLGLLPIPCLPPSILFHSFWPDP